MNWELTLLAVLVVLCVIMWVRIVLLMVRYPDNKPKHDPDFLSFRQIKQLWRDLKEEKNT